MSDTECVQQGKKTSKEKRLSLLLMFSFLSGRGTRASQQRPRRMLLYHILFCPRHTKIVTPPLKKKKELRSTDKGKHHKDPEKRIVDCWPWPWPMFTSPSKQRTGKARRTCSIAVSMDLGVPLAVDILQDFCERENSGGKLISKYHKKDSEKKSKKRKERCRSGGTT